MSLVVQNAVAYIVKMGNLALIKDDAVFHLNGIADNAIFTDDS